MTLVRIIGNSDFSYYDNRKDQYIKLYFLSSYAICYPGKLIGKLPISYQTTHVPKNRCSDVIVPEPKKSSPEYKKYYEKNPQDINWSKHLHEKMKSRSWNIIVAPLNSVSISLIHNR